VEYGGGYDYGNVVIMDAPQINGDSIKPEILTYLKLN